MTRTKSTYLALLAVLLSPMAANVDLIAYDFTGTSASDWTMTGQVMIDEFDLVPFVNLVGVFDSWSFSWTDGVDILGSSNLDSTWYVGDGSPEFTVDAAFNVLSAILCTNGCDGEGAGGWPDIFVLELEGDFFWDASISPEGGCCVSFYGGTEGSVTGPRSVPEPGTLALFAIGLLGLGFARSRTA